MKSFLQANLFSVLPSAFFLLLVSGTGCGSGANQNRPNQKATVQATTTSTSKLFQQTLDYIPATYLNRSDFLGSETIKYKNKLILRLSLQKDKSYQLAVFPSENSGKILDTARRKYPKAFANELPASGVGIDHVFEEHHTKENDFQKLWDEIMKYKLVNYILFEPVVDSNRHFCYKITGVEKLPSDLLAAHGFATKTYYSHPSNHVWK